MNVTRWQFKNDICLLQLSQNVKSTPDVAPICLPKNRLSDNFIGTCYIGGWGVLQESGDEMADRLQEAEVPFVNHGRCQKIYEKVRVIRLSLNSINNFRPEPYTMIWWCASAVASRTHAKVIRADRWSVLKMATPSCVALSHLARWVYCPTKIKITNWLTTRVVDDLAYRVFIHACPTSLSILVSTIML